MKKKPVARRVAVRLQDLLSENAIKMDALVQLLVDKNLITKAEVRDAILAMKQRIAASRRHGHA